MANPIQLKRSTTPGAAPSTGDLLAGELAVNVADGKLFLKRDSGGETIVEIGAASGGGAAVAAPAVPFWWPGAALNSAVTAAAVTTTPAEATWSPARGLLAVTPSRETEASTLASLSSASMTIASTTIDGEDGVQLTTDGTWASSVDLSPFFAVAANEYILVEWLIRYPNATNDPYLRFTLESTGADLFHLNVAMDVGDPGAIAGVSRSISAPLGDFLDVSSRDLQLTDVGATGHDRVYQCRAWVQIGNATSVKLRALTGANRVFDAIISRPIVTVSAALPDSTAFVSLPLFDDGTQRAAWTGTRPMPTGVGILAPRPAGAGVLIEVSDGTTTLHLRQAAGGNLEVAPAGGAALISDAVTAWTTTEGLPVSVWFDGSTVELWVDGSMIGTAARAMGALTGVTIGAAGDGTQHAGVEILRAALTDTPYWRPPFETVMVADATTAADQVDNRFYLLTWPAA